MSKELGEVFRPAPAASIWNTFYKLSLLLCLGFWMLCLPAELILHRRVGKRYANTFFVAVSLFVLVAVAGVILGTTQAWESLPSIHKLADVKWVRVEMPRWWEYAGFGVVLVAAVAAFAAHWIANRRRFATPDQGHSFDSGIPWVVYPPANLVNWARDAGAGTQTDPESALPPPDASRRSSFQLKKILAFPDTLVESWKPEAEIHGRKLLDGQHPYGLFTWFTLSCLEPAALLIFGTLIAFYGLLAFGAYLMLIGVCLFLKGQLAAAEWKERIYSERDHAIEVEAMRNLREGSPLDQVSRVFTVPVSRAVVPLQQAPCLPDTDGGRRAA
jgi:hypothetical protein